MVDRKLIPLMTKEALSMFFDVSIVILWQRWGYHMGSPGQGLTNILGQFIFLFCTVSYMVQKCFSSQKLSINLYVVFVVLVGSCQLLYKQLAVRMLYSVL